MRIDTLINLSGAALCLILVHPRGALGAGGVCDPVSFGVDTTEGNHYAALFLGKGVGQTFVATEVSLASITVWRASTPRIRPTVKIWLAKTDSLMVPDLAHGIIQEGPSLLAEQSDFIPEGQSVPVRFTFDPPIVLPSRGTYAVFFQDPCNYVFDLLYNEGGNVYSPGQLWRVSRPSNGTNCRIDRFPFFYEDEASNDMIFTIEFCRDPETVLKSRTWGSIKGIYR